MTRKEVLQFIAQTNGKVFGVEFIKRTTGERRRMNCRLDVTKHLVRQPDGPPQEPGVTIHAHQLIKVFDMVKRAYRSVPVDGIVAVCVAGQWHDVTSEEECSAGNA